ncbi:MAG: UDP-N-acetylmuramate--L-alanine ligase [Alphaproteobacteria bacterium CG_4_10_14_0_8_um_filter_53_9]|nr:MAG: UDP-N-acetylmuramate--L-alanine ligase [Alphaproteobacteria bacterium CG_4_10_14_0_8_um_filter_53_9]
MMKLFGMDVKKLGTIHFVGIGGIGMSGLALFIAECGGQVSGSDTMLDYAARIKDFGGTLYDSYDAYHVQNASLVVVGTAIKDTNPELMAAREARITVVHRADVLAEIMKNYATIAVAGTHGKTSTTAMVYSALHAAGVPVGVINGGVLQELGSHIKVPPSADKGQEQWLVVEADESDASFLKLKPTVAIVTNIEEEHMDTYGSEEKLLEAFVDFVNSADEAILCGDDPNCTLVESRAEHDVITYGFEDFNDVYAGAYTPQGRGMAFDATLRGGVLPDVVVAMPGAHMVMNALAALATAQLLMADLRQAADGLENFKGVARRFCKVGTFDGADVIDDYGHHPTEIAVTLDGAKKVYPGKVVAVIQPHRYTRLRDLMEDFATSASVADACILMPVHAAGETPIEGVSSDVLAERMMMPKPLLVADESELEDALDSMGLTKGDAIVCLGAGTISKIAKGLVD